VILSHRPSHHTWPVEPGPTRRDKPGHSYARTRLRAHRGRQTPQNHRTTRSSRPSWKS